MESEDKEKPYNNVGQAEDYDTILKEDKGKFYNTQKQADEYDIMVKHAKKAKNPRGDFADKDITLNINPRDTDLYFAYNYAILTQTMNDTQSKIMCQPANNVCLEENLKMLSKEVFSITGYMDRIIDTNNIYYKSFKHPELEKYNPWVIDKSKDNIMDAEFGVQLGYNSRIELIAKNLLWVNRATKEFAIIRRHVVECKSKNIEEAGKHGIEFENVIANVLKDGDMYSGQSLLAQFLDKYPAFIYGDCSKKEIVQDDSYKKVEEIAGKEMTNVNMHDVFKYLSLSTAETTLYEMKNKLIILAIKEIGNLKKSKKMDGIRICRSDDLNSKCDEFNSRLQIILPGYNSPCNVHTNGKFLTDEAVKSDVQFEHKDLHNPGRAACFYKYNNKQIEQIDVLNKTRIDDRQIRECVKYAHDRCITQLDYER